MGIIGKLEMMVAERTKELEEKTKNLQEVNTTLNVLLKKRDQDKKNLEENFVANIGSMVLPYLEKIRKNNLDAQQQFCLVWRRSARTFSITRSTRFRR